MAVCYRYSLGPGVASWPLVPVSLAAIVMVGEYTELVATRYLILCMVAIDGGYRRGTAANGVRGGNV